MTKHWLESAIEWEGAAQPVVFEHVNWPMPPFMPGVTKVTVSRDEDLQLSLAAEGVLQDGSEVARRHQQAQSVPPGSFLTPSEISVDAHGGKLELRVHLGHEPSSVTLSAGRNSFEQHGSPIRLRQTWTQKLVAPDAEHGWLRQAPLLAPSWRSDWYVNGLTNVRFTRHTSRRTPATFERKREYQTLVAPELPGGGDAWDHIVVDTPGVR
ncbi:MAG TPA: hypothetical protein VHU80_06065, partial [Polyangiaceae bacterium]|nr:hypothetical protein [Polyangiaceae bacterium]